MRALSLAWCQRHALAQLADFGCIDAASKPVGQH